MTMSRLMLKIRRPSRHEKVQEYRWPTGNTITAITVTQTDQGSAAVDGEGVPIALSHLNPRADQLVGRVLEHGGRSAVLCSGGVFGHERSRICGLCTGSPVIPHSDTISRADPLPLSSKLATTVSSQSASSSSSSLSSRQFNAPL